MNKVLWTVIFIIVQSTPLSAQTATSSQLPALPPLEVSPSVVEADGVLTLTLPDDLVTKETRFRVGLYLHGNPARLHDMPVNFTLRDGRPQATLRLAAETGVYDVRLLSNDRQRRFLSEAAVILVPGVDREPGWWLLNGTPFASLSPPSAATQSTPAANAPLFLPDLRRDLDRRSKAPTGSVLLPGGEPAKWKTIRLPLLRELSQPDYDFAVLNVRLREEVAAAQARGERGLLGFTLPASVIPKNPFGGPPVAQLPPSAMQAVTSLRTVLQSIVPDAPLILEVPIWNRRANDEATFANAAHDVDAIAAQVDAVVFQVNFTSLSPSNLSLWPLKVARRVAEEQPHYDLPILIDWYLSPAQANTTRQLASSTLLEAFMSGATGFISDASTPRLTADWGKVVQRNLPLFVGSVTLEDAGLLPADDSEDTLRLYGRLRDAGRIPLLARANNRPARRGSAESLAVALGERISQRALNDLLATARSGARLYIEGTPLLDEHGRSLDSRIVTLLGGRATPVNLRRASMMLENPWVFGTAQGRRLSVEQRVTVVLREPDEDEKKAKKGVLSPELSVAARLDDGSPGVIVNLVGEGEVVWMPHRISEQATTPADEDAAAIFYAAITGRMQPALVKIEPVASSAQPGVLSPASSYSAQDVRGVVRASPNGTLLLALFNMSGHAKNVNATVRADAGIALDLVSETALPLTTRGLEAKVRVTLAPHGWTLIAFAKNREALDKERNAPRLKARWVNK